MSLKVDNTKEKIIWLFYLVFALCFTFVIANVIFANEYFKTVPLIITSVLCLVIIFVIYTCLYKYVNVTVERYKKILILFIGVLFVVEVVFGIILRYNPAWDVGAVHKGAAEWVETGTFESYYDYYYGCPNNLGPMAILAFFYKIASFFGVRDYYAVYVVVTSAIVNVTIALVSLICVKIRDIYHGLFVLVLFALSVQYWFIGGSVYSDTMSMVFPILCLWLYLKEKDSDEKKLIIVYMLIGIISAIGSIAKFTTVVIVVAILIHIGLTKKTKELLKAGGLFVSSIVIINLCFSGYIYSNHLDRDIAAVRNRPYLHWTMMGLKGDGRYNPDDFNFTDSIADPDQKKEQVNAEVINRIKTLGVPGIYKLIGRKSAINFGDGTYGISDQLGMPKDNTTFLDKWVIYGGKRYNLYSTYATGMHIAIMIIMLAGAFLSVLKKNDKQKELLIPYLSLLGIWIVLFAWETNRRYTENFVPMIFICATVSMYNINKIIKKRNRDLF